MDEMAAKPAGSNPGEPGLSPALILVPVGQVPSALLPWLPGQVQILGRRRVKGFTFPPGSTLRQFSRISY